MLIKINIMAVSWKSRSRWLKKPQVGASQNNHNFIVVLKGKKNPVCIFLQILVMGKKQFGNLMVVV